MAINIDNFAPYFRDRLNDLLTTHRKCEPVSIFVNLNALFHFHSILFQVDFTKPVLIAGDPARMYRKKVAKQQGIRYSQQQINTCQIFANTLGIKPLQCQTSNQHEFIFILDLQFEKVYLYSQYMKLIIRSSFFQCDFFYGTETKKFSVVDSLHLKLLQHHLFNSCGNWLKSLSSNITSFLHIVIVFYYLLTAELQC